MSQDDKYSEIEVHHIVEAAVNRTLLNKAVSDKSDDKSSWFQNTTSAISVILTLAGACVYVVLDYGNKITLLQEKVSTLSQYNSQCQDYNVLLTEDINNRKQLSETVIKRVTSLETDVTQLQYEIKGLKK